MCYECPCHDTGCNLRDGLEPGCVALWQREMIPLICGGVCGCVFVLVGEAHDVTRNGDTIL